MDWTGRIDAVAANAGIMVEGDALSLSLDDWNRVMAVNATGAFLTARAALPHLIEGGGALVFTASTVGLAGMRGVAGYSASKGAVVALTRQLAADYAAARRAGERRGAGCRPNPAVGIAVSCPRPRRRPFRRADAGRHRPLSHRPLWHDRRCGPVRLLFLASADAGWITGQIIPVDGGLLEIR